MGYRTNNHHLCVAISGLSGCGNTSVSNMLAKTLNVTLINYTFRTLAQERNMAFSEICKLAEYDDSLDRIVDNTQKELSKKQACIVGSRLAIWFITHADIRIYLHANEKTRAKRILKREGGDYESVFRATQERDAHDIQRYKKLYGIDIRNHQSIADVQIDTNTRDKSITVQYILNTLEQRKLIVST